MAQCQSPEELMKLISRIVDAMVNQYLLCGTLQGGLVACGENAYLPKDTEVVLCRQLYELVQDGIDTGKIVAPTVVEVRYEGSTLILHLANGENLTLDLKPLIDGVIDQAFTDCDGQAIHVGTALATCANLQAVQTLLENKLAELDQKVDHNKELTDQEIANTKALLERALADTKELLEQQIAANKELSDQANAALNQRIDDWITDITERMTLLDESITNKIDAATAEWANTILQQLIEQFLETRQVYHDASLIGDGHEAAPLQVSVEWLRAQILAFLPEVVKFTDCCGNDINIGDVLVTCECLDQQLTLLANELKAYAEQQAAEALQDAKDYADEQDQNILQQANNYTDVKAADTLQQANNYTDVKAADTLQQANNYTDEQDQNILQQANNYTDVKAADTLQQANNYTDEQDQNILQQANNYTDVKAADTLQQANNYTDVKAADTLQQANNYTDEQISNVGGDIPYLRNALGSGAEPIVSSYGLALGYNTTASGGNSIALGNGAVASAQDSTALGNTAKASGTHSTVLGANTTASTLDSTALGAYTTASGSHSTALGSHTTASGDNSIALGNTAKAQGQQSTALGKGASAIALNATAIGSSSYASGGSTALGAETWASSSNATALGSRSNALANYTTALGSDSNATANYTTALGCFAKVEYQNSTALGYQASVSGANQVQLGNSSTTTYAYGAVQGRSDKRDKTDVHNSDLGLEFIQKLRPVKFRWDYRDDYINELFPKPKREDFIDTSVVNEADYLVEITDVVREPDEPNLSEADFESTESYELAQQAVHTRNLERQAKYEAALQARREEQLANLAQAKLLVQEQQEAAYAQALQAHQAERIAFMQNPDERKDGSKARQRYHYGLIADELKSTMDELGVDFGGYQNHANNDGMCVKSVGYAELISPLIKAVQELSAQVDDLKQQLEGK